MAGHGNALTHIRGAVILAPWLIFLLLADLATIFAVLSSFGGHLRQAPHVKAVYDLTIAYQHGDEWHAEPTIWDTLSVPGLSDRLGYRFHVHVRRFPLESLPEKDEDLAKWLEERWVEKGEWLEEKRVEWAATKA
ncbi:hypothetical protein BN1723_000088 [Verticillium longisporum]|uniref:Acyltransferase C-terminal domain-containing protein n=1 Tax=Verticillium longisporum TaxID=100787 RepID=A0A0G4KFM4_VERLO|nr:hypothetical protein BN1723_000088 [Verticillium longisporum]